MSRPDPVTAAPVPIPGLRGIDIRALLRGDALGGALLLVAAVVALVWANVAPASYGAVFDDHLPLRQIVNEGLMTLFFFMVGMEIKREVVAGELDSLAKAALPAVAALGGMLLPVAVFLLFAGSGDGRAGWGVPMATDIAFCVGLLRLLEGRVPRSLIAFITALAVFDDIGGILVIAIFFGHGLSLVWLVAAGIVVALTLLLSRRSPRPNLVYGVAGVALWATFHESGLHATLAGVVMGLLIPVRRGPPAHAQEVAGPSPVDHLIHFVHPVVTLVVLPLFALANAGVTVTGLAPGDLFSGLSWGTALALFAGKQLGVFAFTWGAVRAGWAPRPRGASWRQVYGVSILAGVGFTVALFMASLAFADAPVLHQQAKLGILIGSFAAGVAGFWFLRAASRRCEAPRGVSA